MSDYRTLLARIRVANVSDRIDFRDALVALGPDVIPDISELMLESGCTGLAIATLERLAAGNGRAAAVEALRAGRELLPSRREEIDRALERAGIVDRPPTAARRTSRSIEQLHRVPPIPPHAGTGWPGFQTKEFGRIADTVWRSRDGERSLAPMITRSLRGQHEHFDSYGVERRPQIHFFISDRYRWAGNRQSGWRAAKLMVYAHGPTDENLDVPLEVVAGLYVEKTDGKEDYGPLTEQWDWVWFIRALRRPDVQAALATVMARHELLIGDYRGQGFSYETAVGGRWQIRDGVLTPIDGEADTVSWEAFADYLDGLPRDRWHGLHIWKAWPADLAIDAGQPFAMQVIFPVVQDLARVYLMVLQDALPPGDQNYRVVRRRMDGTPAQLEFAVNAHEKAGHFSVPTAVMGQLQIPDDGQVTLEVRADGRLLYAGTLRMKSKNEIYPLVDDPRRAGLEQIRPKALLHVLIEKAASS